MAKHNASGANRDYHLQLASADAFRRLAQPLLPEIARTLPEGPMVDPSNGLGDLVACAANLAFAVELYLKLLIALPGRSVPQTHDLRALWDAIPDWIQAKVAGRYDAARPQWQGTYASVTIAYAPRKATPEWDNYATREQDLQSLLSRSSDLFETWRYMFEIAPTPPGEPLPEHRQFEYGLLDCACGALRDTITEVTGPVPEA
ncbi:MAG: hypothetical protein ABSA21_08370 [Candidatus Limnocylindrales bacterium]